MPHVGDQQLRTLIVLASPTCIMLTSDKSSRAMVKSGLLQERNGGEATCITAAGLRALADAMEAGRVETALEAMKKDAADRRAKIAAQRAAKEEQRRERVK